MASSKVEMSLDDIIRANKGKQRKGIASPGKTPATKKGVVKRKPLKGVVKRKTAGQRNTGQIRRLKAGSAKAKKSTPSVTAATKKLVNKLVKKAISQTQKKQPVIRNVVVPIGRRTGGPVKKTIVLKGVSNRSRIIGRRQRVAVLPSTVNLVRRKARRTPVVYNTSPTVVQVPARRGNYRQIVYQESPQPRIYRQVQPRRGGASVRDQVRAMRQQEVVYIQPQSYQSRQPRRQVYVQEQSRRGQGGYGRFQRRQNRGKRVFSKDAPIIDPPNFLQRLPPTGSPSRRFVYR